MRPPDPRPEAPGGLELHPPPRPTPEEEKLLVRAALDALRSHLQGGEAAPAPPPPGLLSERHPLFVSIYAGDDLRGCLGSLVPRQPLLLAVAETAVQAATQDRRFDPLVPAEFRKLSVEISILGPFRAVDAPERAPALAGLRPGEYGLMVRSGARSGLLLPQVAGRHGWESERFLAETCRKAGLSPQAGHSTGTELFVFRSFAVSGAVEGA